MAEIEADLVRRAQVFVDSGVSPNPRELVAGHVVMPPHVRVQAPHLTRAALIALDGSDPEAAAPVSRVDDLGGDRPLDHVERASLPWRDIGRLTECGLLGDVVQLGEQRIARAQKGARR